MIDMGNMYAALVQHVGSVHAVCRQRVGSMHAACNPHNPHNPPAPGPVFLPYYCSIIPLKYLNYSDGPTVHQNRLNNS